MGTPATPKKDVIIEAVSHTNWQEAHAVIVELRKLHRCLSSLCFYLCIVSFFFPSHLFLLVGG